MTDAVRPLAPIAIFAHRRPSHLERVLDSLRSNPLAGSSALTIFIDGPRDARDTPGVTAVRDLAESTYGFASVAIVASDTNLGLARSLTGGISRMLEHHNRVIVIEDDVVVSPHFLAYMNDHLDIYAEDADVASIHGYVYPHPRYTLAETFFIRGADCWGWGTWRRAWDHFNTDGRFLLAELRRRGLVDEFNFDGTAPYEEMLVDQIAGRNDSWAVRWYASALLAGMVTLYPDRAMALNIGEDGSGSHGGSSRTYKQVLATEPVLGRRIPILESQEGRRAFEDFFRERHRVPSSRIGRLLWRHARRFRSVLRHRRIAS